MTLVFQKNVNIINYYFYRILGSIEKKESLLTSNAITSVSSNLAVEDDEELLKAVTKCLAKFTSHQCDQYVAMQVQGDGQGFQRLVECSKHNNKSIWEPALATLVNLSFLESLRPNLGNAGAISVFIDRANGDDDNKLSANDFLRTITALCFYCHESVNRMKLRDTGGLRLFVNILGGRSEDLTVIHYKIIKSLMQFAYDDLGLKVLQNEGLVPALVAFIDAHNLKNSLRHSCEVTICADDDDNDDAPGPPPVTDDDAIENQQQEQDEVQQQDVQLEHPGEPVGAAVSSVEAADHEVELVPSVPEAVRPKTEDKQYRINSPSYREVQNEFEEFSRIRLSLPGSSSSLSTGWMTPTRSGQSGLSPLYSRSPSPLRSGSPVPSYAASSSSSYSSPRWSSSAGSSPRSLSEDRCPPVTYSPIEFFSDEDDDDDQQQQQQQQPLVSSPPPTRMTSLSSESSPASKRSRTTTASSPSYVAMPPTSYFSFETASCQVLRRSSSTASTASAKSEESQISIILQILSR